MATTPTVDLTPVQAHFVLSQLVDSGRLSNTDIQSALDDMPRQIARLSKQLAALRAAGGRGRRTEGVRHVSQTTKASWALQGQYMGYIRQIPKSRRGFFKAMAKAKGREATVRAMKKALKK